MKLTWKLAISLCPLLTLTPLAHAQSAPEMEAKAYCQYVKDQARAERALDTGLEAYGRLGQADTDVSKQVVIGVQKSLSKHLQGIAATRSAQLECALFRQTINVDRATKFEMSAIDQRVAADQVKRLENVMTVIDEEKAAAERRQRAGDATIADVMALNDRRDAVMMQLHSAEVSAAQVVPDFVRGDLNQALREIDHLTNALQEEVNHKQALQAWDVALIGGIMKPFGSVPSGQPTRTQPFVGLSITYNLDARGYRQDLDHTTTSLIAMRHQQNDDLFQRVAALERSLSQNLTLERSNLARLVPELDQLTDEYDRIKNLTSPEASRAKSAIRVDTALVNAEVNLARFRISLLSQDYAQNY